METTILDALGIAGFAAAIPVIALILMIRRDLRATNKDREQKAIDDAIWRTNIERDIKMLMKAVNRIPDKINGH